MNYEFIENAMKARQYGASAMKALVPEDLKRHVDVIENELTDMMIELLQKRKKEFYSEEYTENQDENSQDEQKQKSSVKKITIE